MSKVKIEVPAEFNVFMEKALDVAESLKTDPIAILTAVENMAKFQYYIRGRLDSLKRFRELYGTELSNRQIELILDEIEELKEISHNVVLIGNALIE